MENYIAENKVRLVTITLVLIDFGLLFCSLLGNKVVPTIDFFLFPFWLIPIAVYLNALLILSCIKDTKHRVIKILIGILGLALFVISTYSDFWLMDAADFAPNSTFIPTMQSIGSAAFVFSIFLPIQYFIVRFISKERKDFAISNFKLVKNNFLNIAIYLAVIIILPIILGSIPNHFPHP